MKFSKMLQLTNTLPDKDSTLTQPFEFSYKAYEIVKLVIYCTLLQCNGMPMNYDILLLLLTQ